MMDKIQPNINTNLTSPYHTKQTQAAPKCVISAFKTSSGSGATDVTALKGVSGIRTADGAAGVVVFLRNQSSLKKTTNKIYGHTKSYIL